MYVCDYIHLFTTKYCIKQCIIGSQRQLQILPSSLCFFFSLLPVLYPSTFLTSTILTSIPAQASIIITKSASHICLHLQHPPSLYIFLRDLEPSVSTFFFFFVLVLTPFVWEVHTNRYSQFSTCIWPFQSIIKHIPDSILFHIILFEA